MNTHNDCIEAAAKLDLIESMIETLEERALEFTNKED